MREEGKLLTGFSVPAGRRAEFEEALLKLKLLRPFDSKSQIIVDAVIAAAAAVDEKAQTEEQPINKWRPVLAAA
jgi:hypothetical protein